MHSNNGDLARSTLVTPVIPNITPNIHQQHCTLSPQSESNWFICSTEGKVNVTR